MDSCVYSGNQMSASFTIYSAEVGATYNYLIDDTNYATNFVIGAGTVIAATHQVTGIDLSGLDDDNLTLIVSLTDVAGNNGADD